MQQECLLIWLDKYLLLPDCLRPSTVLQTNRQISQSHVPENLVTKWLPRLVNREISRDLDENKRKSTG
jgi:hypothetical protein